MAAVEGPFSIQRFQMSRWAKNNDDRQKKSRYQLPQWTIRKLCKEK
jgi:hypothetical protein